MYEVEVKARLRDRAAILAKLQELGCKFGEELHQVDYIFIPPDIKFPPPLNTPVLRVRKENGRSLFTLKISQSGHQDAIERELEISDGDKMIDSFRLMKWQQVPTVDKKRIKTKLGDKEIVLDQVEELGEYMEVEKIVTEENPEARKQIQQELCDFLLTLGVAKEDLMANAKYDIMLEEKYGMR